MEMIKYPTDERAFCHAVRYRHAVMRAWMKRTGRKSSYKCEEVPAYIDIPTNEETSRCEVIEFKRGKLQPGVSYCAYLTRHEKQAWTISTFMGDVLATVLEINHRRVRAGYLSDVRGTFWARGIDGRLYYGWHNGTNMWCKMRLSKDQKDRRQ